MVCFGLKCVRTIETLEQGVKYLRSVLILNFEHISHLVQVFELLTLNGEMPARLFLLKSQGQ